jgi:hypothetical protein
MGDAKRSKSKKVDPPRSTKKRMFVVILGNAGERMKFQNVQSCSLMTIELQSWTHCIKITPIVFLLASGRGGAPSGCWLL